MTVLGQNSAAVNARAQPAHRAPATCPAGLHARLQAAIGDRKVVAIASAVGINKETVRRYMRGAVPSAVFLERVCTVYGISADWLLCGRGSPRLSGGAVARQGRVIAGDPLGGPPESGEEGSSCA